jgi:hypothetical protein
VKIDHRKEYKKWIVLPDLTEFYRALTIRSIPM